MIDRVVALIPSIGIVVFILLYCFATTLYSGGSVAFPDALTFSWVHNYWCDLLTPQSINGLDNPAMPYSIASMILLSGIVGVFFFQFADAFGFSNLWRKAIKICGTISMICGALIFTSLHNVMIGVASLFALVPLVGIFKGMITTRTYGYLVLGVVCAILLFFCNYFYYTERFLEWLPLFQKIALAAVLLWIVIVNVGIANSDVVL